MAGKNNIGDLDQRVTFKSETLVSDGQGGFTSSGWSNIASTPTMWAAVFLSPGTEGDAGEARQANRYMIDVRIRNRSDLTEKMALDWRGRRYNIRSIMPFDNRREFLMIKAEGGAVL